MGFQLKQCVVVRGELRLSTGKWCAQVAHAAVSSAETARSSKPLWHRRWIREGQKKVVLVVSSEADLKALLRSATDMKLPASPVFDMGLTEIPPDTFTCLGIGPAPEQELDKLTGSLPLF